MKIEENRIKHMHFVNPIHDEMRQWEKNLGLVVEKKEEKRMKRFFFF